MSYLLYTKICVRTEIEKMKNTAPEPWSPEIHILAQNNKMMKNDSDEWQDIQMHKVLWTHSRKN